MRYGFDLFELDTEQRSLVRDNQEVAIEPKVFDVLQYLVENRDRMVPRDELLDEIWPGVFVSDGTLSRCLSRLRGALGQPRGVAAPILTKHGRGYRFVSDIFEQQAPPEAVEPTAGPDTSGSEYASRESERRFVSVVWVCYSAPATEPEKAHRKGVGLIREAREAAVRFSGKVGAVIDNAFTIEIGFPDPVESPAQNALSLCQILHSCARRLSLELVTTISSGIAIARETPGILAGQTILSGVSVLRVPKGAGAGSEILVDGRTRNLLQNQADFVPVASEGNDGAEVFRLNLLNRNQTFFRHLSNTEPRFTGREGDLLDIERIWSHLPERGCQYVSISGEAGIGKSALVREFLQRNSIPEKSVFAVKCSENYQSIPFYPVLVMLRQILDIGPDTSPLRVLQKIEAFLDASGRPVADHLPLLASLLSASPIDSGPTDDINLNPARRRDRTMDTVLSLVLGEAEKDRVVLWIDDVHWADPSTLAMAERFMERCSDVPLMILGCSRDASAGVTDRHRVAARLALGRMSTNLCRRLLSEISELGLLPSGLIDTIATRSEGVPLFLREIVQMAMQKGSEDGRAIDLNAIPDSLQGLLATRLASTGRHCEVAHWGALIGKTFSRAMLRHLCGLSEPDLDEALET
ncbi:MAG: AAA family ATPase, partial [Hyphomicrobiales bacterium]|nr:AAA family ATPase [Hyphomicrobiales bacterium]